MQEYKYTYQDWVEGKIESYRFGRLLLGKEMSGEDLGKIVTQQHKAFLYYIDIVFEAIKRFFMDRYSGSLLKDELLDDYIGGYKFILDNIRAEHEIIVTSALNPSYDGRYELTKEEVDTYLSATVDSRQIEIFVVHFTTDFEDAGIEYDKEEKAPFKYILRSNFYNWLVWFRRQQELKDIEPSLKINPDKMPKEIANLIGVKWHDLFKDPKQAEKVLKLISEHLSDTGQWLTEPKGRHLVALCTELESKGYIINSGAISNPVKAEAFNKQFDTDLDKRNFQPADRQLAEVYRELFHHIPPYKLKP